MSDKPRGSFEFDPYKRPPAARLLAVLTVGLLIGWMVHGGDRHQLAEFRRDPAKFAARMDRMSQHGAAFDVVIALLIVTAIVFAVDGLTSLFGRWLTEREQPKDASPAPDSQPSKRASALLGPPPPPPSEN